MFLQNFNDGIIKTREFEFWGSLTHFKEICSSLAYFLVYSKIFQDINKHVFKNKYFSLHENYIFSINLIILFVKFPNKKRNILKFKTNSTEVDHQMILHR